MVASDDRWQGAEVGCPGRETTLEVAKYAVVDVNGVGVAAFVLPHEFAVGHVSVDGWGAA